MDIITTLADCNTATATNDAGGSRLFIEAGGITILGRVEVEADGYGLPVASITATGLPVHLLEALEAAITEALPASTMDDESPIPAFAVEVAE